jgi:integrase
MPRPPAPVKGVYQREDDPSGAWYARIRVDGKLVKKSFGRDRTAAVECVEKARTLRRIGDGHLPKNARSLPKTARELAASTGASGVLVSELCDDLLRHIQSKPNLFKDQRNPPYRIGLIRKQFGDRVASTVRPFEIADWLDSLGKAPATINRYKVTFSSLYRYGKQRDKIQVNPAREVSQHRLNNGVIRFLKPDEEKRIRTVLQKGIDACGPHNERRKKRLLHRIYELDIALGTGMRKGEQYGLRWGDIDFDRRVITLRDTKNGSSRTVPMIQDVYTAFRSLKKLGLERKDRAKDRPNSAPEDIVFGIGDNKKWWEAALKEAKVKHFRWHDLRHTFCSRLAQAGVSLKVIQEAAGHKTIAMSARYAHMDHTTLQNAMAVLNRSSGTG